MTEQEFRVLMNDITNWKKTRKIEYCVWVQHAPIGLTIYNTLENSESVAKLERCVVVSGTAGEQWIISDSCMSDTYVNIDGTGISQIDDNPRLNNGWTKIKAKSNGALRYALQLPIDIRNFPIIAEWGEELLANWDGSDGHGTGDFLLIEADADCTPRFDKMSVINYDVFLRTYDASEFGLENIGTSRLPAPEGFVYKDGIFYTGDN